MTWKPGQKSESVRKVQPLGQDIKQRRCIRLDCGQEFRSTWAGDRVCPQCRYKATPRVSTRRVD